MDPHDGLDDRGLRAGLELVGEPALAAVLTVLVEGHLGRGGKTFRHVKSRFRRRDTHEDTSTALGRRALAAKTLDLAVRLHLVVLEDGHLDLLALVLDLLGGLNASHIINTNMSPASRQRQRTLYVFFLRFLAPPRRRSTRWRVDSFWML